VVIPRFGATLLVFALRSLRDQQLPRSFGGEERGGRRYPTRQAVVQVVSGSLLAQSVHVVAATAYQSTIVVFVGVKLIASIARKHLIEEKVGLLPT